MDIYNHNASASIISIGGSPKVTDHFPMATWKQKVITGAILTGVALFSAGAGLGISAAITSGAQLVSWVVGIGIGAIGGSIDAMIYSIDNQDYSQFKYRVRDGIVVGISAASLGMAIRAVINYKPLSVEINQEQSSVEIYDSPQEFLKSLDNNIQRFLYDERTNINDLDNVFVDDSFRFSSQ